MKAIRKLLLITVLIGVTVASTQEVWAAPEGKNLEAEVKAISDHLVREALLELLQAATAYQPPAEGVGDPNDVFLLSLKSQRVYVFLAGAEVSYTKKYIAGIKATIRSVFDDVVFRKLAWIEQRSVTDKNLQRDYKAIKLLYGKMKLPRTSPKTLE